MKHTVRSHRMLALLLTLVMVISMLPVSVFAAEHTIVGNPEQVQLGADAAAQRVNNFNMGWKFYLGDNANASKQGFDDSAWDNVNLPHDFSIIQHFTASGEAESGFLPGGTGWYRKSFVIGEEAAGKTFLLNFDGVYSDAYVYVNGKFVGEHHYGYTNFAFDITEHLTCDGATQNVVAVKAVNNVPSSRWYSGSGIYRDVTLYALDPVHVDLNGVTVTTPGIADGDGTAAVKVNLVNDGNTAAEVTVKTTIGGVAAETTVSVPARSTAVAELEVAVANPELWSLENPNLYTALTEVLVNGDVVDSCEDTFGYRWTEWKSSGFYLNGEAVKLNGVCMHHDQGGLGSAAYYDAMYRQMSIMKDMGANAIRITHNPGDEDLIAICNELGLLVIEETFDGLVDPKNTNYNDFSKHFESDASSGLYGYVDGMTCAEYATRSVVKRDKNAPSIIAWSFGNEIQEGTYWNNVDRYDEICANYIEWVNEEDGTRVVTSGDNNRGGDNRLVDVINTITNAGGIAGFNYANSASQLSSLADRFGGSNGVIIASETASHTNSRGQYRNQNNNGNSDGKYHLTSYDTSAVGWGITAHDSIYNTYQHDKVAGEFVWTGFDYIGEPTPWNGTGTGDSGRGAIPNSSYFGIVETSGFPKDSFYLYRAQWNKAATTVHLVTAWDADNQYISGGKTPVWVYTNAAKVELYLNDALIGTTVRTPVTSPAGHTYYTYAATSNNSSVCTAATNYNADALYSIFNVAYTAGTLTAKAYDEAGNEIALNENCGQYTVTTPGAASQIVATANLTEFPADNQSLVYVEVDVTDANGNLKTTATNNITFSVEGPAEIAGVDNGDQATVRKYQNPYVLTDRQNANIDAYAGKALVILRATDEAGEITLNISGTGLEGETITINALGSGDSADEGLVSYEMVRDYSVMAGNAPELETDITGYLADGTAIDGTITWRAVSEELYGTAGDHTITGTASFPGYEDVRVSARLHVIPNVVALRNVSAATMEGIAPVLPDAVSGILADGELSGTFMVDWDEVDAAEFDTIGEIVTVNGTAAVFGEQKLNVTCTVRVAEAVNTESVNVAPMAETVRQDVPAGYESDNLMSINNGVKKPGDNTNERWTNWNYRTTRDNATLTLTWATAQMVSGVNLYYYFDNCCAYPESIEFSYSLDNQNYQVIGHTAEQVETYSLGEQWSYTFDEPINPVGLKVKLTQQDGTSGNHCVGLTELEVMTYAASLETQTGAALSAIKVDGTTIEGFDPAVFDYEIAAGEITVEAAENVGITVLPMYKGYIRILTVSEDGASSNVYTLAVSGEVCNHENTEILPAVEATCTRDGKSEGKRCTDCGDILIPQETIPALGHTEVTIPGTPATLNAPGLSDGVKCSVCGTILVQQEPIPVLNYNDGIIPLSDLIATAGDWQKGYEDSEGPADLAVDDNFNTIWHTDWYGTSNVNHWFQFEVLDNYDVTGLRYLPRQQGNTNGTITKYEIHVSNDGTNWTKIASGNWANSRDWKVAEFEPQNVKYVRLYSKEAVSDVSYVVASAAEIRLVGDLAEHVHEYVDWTVTTEPTCTDAGVETGTCSCGRTQTREIPALGHAPAEAVRENEKAATCFAAGSYESVVYCERCGTEISRETVAIPALNHANTIVRDAMEPTCTEEGYTGDTWCLDCGRRLSVGEVIPATGHTWENGTCIHCGAQDGNVGTGTFVDVPADAWFAPYVEWAVENEITKGIDDTHFGPDMNVTRAQVVTFLWAAEGKPEPASNDNPFVDVAESDWFYKAVLWASQNGITSGLDATHFGPTETCVREQVVTFLWAAEGKPAASVEVPFTDVASDAWYYAPVAWALENGITSGMGDGTFGVGAVCTRAQVVTFLFSANEA